MEKHTIFDEVDEKDLKVLELSAMIINEILLRNNLDCRCVVVDKADEIVADSKDEYEKIARGQMFVNTRDGR